MIKGNPGIKQIGKLLVLLVLVAINCSITHLPVANATTPSTIGMWYSTCYAKVAGVQTTWVSGFGASSSAQFLADVNGDGKADAVVFNSDGSWDVALSNGNGFNAPTRWATGHGYGSAKQLMADVNGDGKADAVVFFSDGSWYVALVNSSGTGFNAYTQWTTGHGSGSANQMLADVNGDGKADAVVFFSTGSWYVALANSSGTGFNGYSLWTTGHGSGSQQQMLGDIDGDGKADAIVYFSSGGQWYAAVSNGSSFNNYFLWENGIGTGSQSQLLADGNGDGKADTYAYFSSGSDWYMSKTKASYGYETAQLMNHNFAASANKQLVADVIGSGKKASVAFFQNTGVWQVQPYHYYQYNEYNTWDAWNIKYLPKTLGAYQTYDSGDSAVIDEHLSVLAAAKVDFILMDETNNIYVDDGYIWDRAKKVADRIRIWNTNPINRKIKYAIAIGGIQFSNDPTTLEWEANEVWNTFVNTSLGGTANYFYLNGKPFIANYAGKTTWTNYTGDKSSSGRFTLRWVNGDGFNLSAGEYGWAVPAAGTFDDTEVMVVMPGWNNHVNTPVSRQLGDFYANSNWSKVLLKKPSIVMINSFNEYGEETAVGETDTSLLTGTSEKWYNHSNVLDPSMYWNATKQYILQLNP